MKAVVYHGPRNVSVDEVPDPKIEKPTDALVRITATNICGSDLHMYEGRTDFKEGRVFGHENVGEVIGVGEYEPAGVPHEGVERAGGHFDVGDAYIAVLDCLTHQSFEYGDDHLTASFEAFAELWRTAVDQHEDRSPSVGCIQYGA